MRHLKHHQSLGVTREHRAALLSNLAAALIRRGRIETTLTKARALRPFIEKVITKAKKAAAAAEKKDSLHLRRVALRKVRDEDAITLLFNEKAAQFAKRCGGYTRIYKLAPRRIGDCRRDGLDRVRRRRGSRLQETRQTRIIPEGGKDRNSGDRRARNSGRRSLASTRGTRDARRGTLRGTGVLSLVTPFVQADVGLMRRAARPAFCFAGVLARRSRWIQSQREHPVSLRRGAVSPGAVLAIKWWGIYPYWKYWSYLNANNSWVTKLIPLQG